MPAVMAATGWHGVEDLSGAQRIDVLLFVLAAIGAALLWASISRRTDNDKDVEVKRTPQHNVRDPRP
jgi:hypothetical protein